jgi:hypothetical protein
MFFSVDKHGNKGTELNYYYNTLALWRDCWGDLIIQNVHNFFFRIWYFITQSSFKALFQNRNYVTDQLNKFKFGAILEPVVHSARLAELRFVSAVKWLLDRRRRSLC